MKDSVSSRLRRLNNSPGDTHGPGGIAGGGAPEDGHLHVPDAPVSNPPDPRPDWEEYFLGIATAVAARADCRRARYGAVIVDTANRIIGTGYNGGPSGGPSCLRGQCPRGLLSAEEMPHNSADYSDCVAVHAETNAIAYARGDCRGAVMYLAEADGAHRPPCDACSKLIMAAGLRRVITGHGGRIAVTPSGLHGLGFVG